MLGNKILWERISLCKTHKSPGLLISHLCVRQNNGLHQTVQHRKPHVHAVGDIFKPMTVTPEVPREFTKAMALNADIALTNWTEKELSGTTFQTKNKVLVNGVEFQHITTQSVSAAILSPFFTEPRRSSTLVTRSLNPGATKCTQQ